VFQIPVQGKLRPVCGPLITTQLSDHQLCKLLHCICVRGHRGHPSWMNSVQLWTGRLSSKPLILQNPSFAPVEPWSPERQCVSWVACASRSTRCRHCVLMCGRLMKSCSPSMLLQAGSSKQSDFWEPIYRKMYKIWLVTNARALQLSCQKPPSNAKNLIQLLQTKSLTNPCKLRLFLGTAAANSMQAWDALI
jgi:hypothetical protein